MAWELSRPDVPSYDRQQHKNRKTDCQRMWAQFRNGRYECTDTGGDTYADVQQVIEHQSHGSKQA